MGSLREIKTQIGSVKATQQITSAMQMVASIKMQQAERTINRFRPYREKISQLLTDFIETERDFVCKFEEKRTVKKVAILAFSGDMSLCGAFNSNVTKKLLTTLEEYKHLSKENITLYTIGKKTDQVLRKMEITPDHYYEELAKNPDYEQMSDITDQLMQQFLDKEIDEVVLVYHQFTSKGVQTLVQESLLPLSFNRPSDLELELSPPQEEPTEYIVEPGRAELLNELVPKIIKIRMYNVLLDSYGSEQAARNMAMQTATDNADDLLDELSLVYNKMRQQSITNELLDIIGATFK